jgi:hypothetical protein
MAIPKCDRCDDSGLIRVHPGRAYEYAHRCPGCCPHPDEERVETVEKRWPASRGGGHYRSGVRVNCGRCGAIVALPSVAIERGAERPPSAPAPQLGLFDDG